MRKIVTIPTIIGIVLLLAGVVAGVFGIQQGKTWFLRAAPEEQPKEVRITNVTDSSFNVSWITDTAVRGFVKFGDSGGSLPEVALDEKDQGKAGQELYDVHYVTVKGLKAGGSYEFKIGSGKRLYDDSSKAFTIRTAPLTKAGVGDTDLVSGSITSGDKPAVGAVVYIENSKLTPLSAMVKSTGTYTIPLSTARTKDLKDLYTGFGEGESLELLAEYGAHGRATATVNVKNRDNIPPIDIPGSYDFSAELPRDSAGAIILPQITPSGSGSQSSTSTSAVSPTPIPGSKFSFANLPTPTESDEISVLYPSINEQVEVTKPEFSGSAPPGKSLTITVQSTPQSAQVKADTSGTWKWSPPAGLAPGEHTITISYVDKTGTLRKIVRKFTIGANATEGNSVALSGELAFTATPSATLAPSPTVTVNVTVTATPSPTPTVIASVSGTISPTMRAALPATEAGIPKSGTAEVTIFMIVLGVILTGSGILVLKNAKNEERENSHY